MAAADWPDGYPIRMALGAFLSGRESAMADQLLHAEAMFPDRPHEGHTRAAWSFLATRVLGGELEVTGYLERASTLSIVGLGLIRTSRPDIEQDTLKTSIGKFYGVLVRRRAALDAASSPVEQRRRSPGLDYSASDAALRERMRAMIAAGEARNPTDAARALVKDAAGGGSEKSKVTRLTKGYR